MLPRAAAAVLALALALGTVATTNAVPAQADSVPSGHFSISSAIGERIPGYIPTSATITLLATDTAAPTGTVTLTIGDTTITTTLRPADDPLHSFAIFSVPGLEPGAHTMVLTYSGDSIYPAKQLISMPVSVLKVATNMELTADPPVLGEDFVLTATVTSVTAASTPTGTVELKVGTRDYAVMLTPSGRPGAAIATLALSDLAPGAVSVTGVYRGSDIHYATAAVATFNPAPRPVAIGIAGAVVGSALDLHAYVAERGTATRATGELNTGVVEFFANGDSLGTGSVSDGTASLATADLPAGDYVVLARYSDASGVYAASDSSILRLTIVPPVPVPSPQPTTDPEPSPLPTSDATPELTPAPTPTTSPTAEPTTTPEPTPTVAPTATAADQENTSATPAQAEQSALATTGGSGLGLGLLAIAGALLIAGTVLRRRRV